MPNPLLRAIRGNRPTILERFRRQSLQNRGVTPARLSTLGGGGGRKKQIVQMGLPLVALARVAPRALPWIARGGRAISSFISSQIFSRGLKKAVGLGFIYEGYNLAKAISSGEPKKAIPTKTQLGATIGATFSLPGALFGALEGRVTRTGKSIYDIIRQQSVAPLQSIATKWETRPEWLGGQGVTIEAPQTEFYYGGSVTNISSPGAPSVSVSGGGGNNDMIMFALLASLGLVGGGYLLGRKKKKYKKRRRSKKR